MALTTFIVLAIALKSVQTGTILKNEIQFIA